jgi:hypothetical protein
MATATAPQLVTKRVELPMELHIAGSGNIVRYTAEGAKANTKVLAAIQKSVFGGTVPESFKLVIEFEAPADPIIVEETKVEDTDKAKAEEPKGESKPAAKAAASSKS